MRKNHARNAVLMAAGGVGLLSLAGAGTAYAAVDASWIGTGSGTPPINWSDTSKWTSTPTSGFVPNGVDDIARITTGTAPTTLNISGVVIGQLINDQGKGWQINKDVNDYALTFQVSSGSALIRAMSAVSSGLTINPNVNIASDLLVQANGTDAQSQSVTLNGTLTGTGNVTLDLAGGGNNATRTINVASVNTTGTLTAQGNKKAGDVTTVGPIGSNVTTLTKTGVSTVVLTGTNSYTGNTSVSGGILRTNSLGTALLTLNGGTLETSANFTRGLGGSAGNVRVLAGTSGFSARDGAITISLGGASPTGLTWGSADFAPTALQLNAASANNTLDFKNAIDLGTTGTNTRTIQVDANVATMSGNLTNSGGTQSLTKTGNGALVLTGSNSYNGTTTINGGVLRANDGTSLAGGPLVLNGGVFETGVNLDRDLGTTSGQMRISGGSSGFSANGAPIQVAFGTIASPTALTWGNADFAPSTLVLNAATANNTLEFKNAVSLGSANATRTVQVDANVATMSGVLSNTGAGTLNLTKTGAGALVLSNTNTYNGTTTVSGGVLRATDGTSLPGGPLVLNGGVFETGVDFDRDLGITSGQMRISGGTSGFSANGAPIQVAFGSVASPTALTWGSADFAPGTLILNASTANNALEFKNAVSLGSANATRTVQVDANVATMSGVLSRTAGTLNLTKTGTGTLKFTAGNTYNGETKISAGTLLVSNTTSTESGVGIGDVAINGGTLGGTGYVGLAGDSSSVSFANGVGGKIAPGESGAGRLTINGNLSFDTSTAATRVFEVDITGAAPGTGYDQLVVNDTTDIVGGAVTLTDGSLLVNLGYTPALNQTFTILDKTASGAITGTFSGLADNSQFVVGPATFRIDYDGGLAGGGNDVVLTVISIPEPTMFGVLAGATGGLMLLRRRRQSR